MTSLRKIVYGLPVIVCAYTMAVPQASAVEVVQKNDSAAGASDATPCMCFIPDDEVAVWLTASCTGNIVAVQVFWESPLGGEPSLFEDSISLHASGTFPTPGSVLQNAGAVPATIVLPSLNDGVFNEFRFLDPSAPMPSVPLSVPVSSGQTFAVSLKYINDSSGGLGATTAWDQDGCQSGLNAAQTGAVWTDACLLGVGGDWIIRAIVDCEVSDTPATSEWGLLSLAIIMLAVGTLALRGRAAHGTR